MTLFICSNCGSGSASWYGRCPDCGAWNTLTERKDLTNNDTKEEVKKINIVPLKKISLIKNKNRLKTKIYEFDRVLGDGIVPGEVILLSGEPGIGKSTLLLQSISHFKPLYISGEESSEQVKNRAERLKINLDNFFFSEDLQVEGIVAGINEMIEKPDIIIIDSIQTIYSKDINSPPGTVSQIKETTAKLINLSKKTHIPTIIVGHITKEGDIAGPKTLEHMVDCVLLFEGEKSSNYRILRSAKNRFGGTDEIGIFEMKGYGLQEVNNPLVFIEENNKNNAPGKAIVGVVEGKRPLFFEIQTLAVPTVLSIPRRIVKGVDYNKVLLLLAVIRKHLQIPLDKYDIYVNVIGGVDIKSTSADLGIIVSLVSSVKNIIIPSNNIYIGEVGLLGEIRKVFFEDKVIKEAKRLGFAKIISPQNLKNIKDLKLIS